MTRIRLQKSCCLPGRQSHADPVAIAELNLPVQVINLLEEHLAAIYVSDVLEFRGADLITRIPNFGPKALQQLQRELSKIGLSLKNEGCDLSTRKAA